MGWGDLVQLTSANNFFFSDSDGAMRKITTPNVKCGGNRATAFFFYSIPASIWQMFTTESKEPLEIMDLDGSSSLYLCQSDPAGLHQESHTGWELNGSPHFQELLSEACRTAISRGRLNRLSKHL